MAQVLVAESDRNARAAIRLALTEMGYIVQEVETGMAALTQMAASARPLVVVLNSRLPDLDGTQIVRFARNALRPGWTASMVLLSEPHTPRLFDGLFDESIRAPRAGRASARQAPQELVKPFDLDALLAAVQLATSRLSGSHRRVAWRDTHATHETVPVESYG